MNRVPSDRAGDRPRRAPRSAAQDRVVTLPDAIRLAERTQPGVVQAQAGVRTAAAQRRSAWGAFLPIADGQLFGQRVLLRGRRRGSTRSPASSPSGNNTNRSVSTSLSASVDLFTGFRRGAELQAAKAGQAEADASLVDARFQQALTTTNAVLRRAERGPARRRPRGERPPGRGAAQGVGRQAPRRLGDALGLAALAGDAGQRPPRPDPGADRPGDGGGQPGAAQVGEVGRVQRGGRLELPPSRRAGRHRGDSGRRPRAARRGSRPRSRPRASRAPTCAPPARPTGPA